MMLSHQELQGGGKQAPLTKPAAMPMLDSHMANGIIIKGGFQGLDLARIATLIKRSFGKELVPGYFNGEVKAVVVQEDYLGIAIVKEMDGIAYLDKFAVDPVVQKNGVGKKIWAALTDLYPALAWRAKEGNRINGWYEKQSDGHVRHGKWEIFWKNLTPEAALIEKIAHKAETLVG